MMHSTPVQCYACSPARQERVHPTVQRVRCHYNLDKLAEEAAEVADMREAAAL